METDRLDAARLTLFDLIEAVDEFSETEEEAVATIFYMLRTGHARPSGGLDLAREPLGQAVFPFVSAWSGAGLIGA